MTVNLSPLAGAGAQFFDNNGVPLVGGKLYSYAAGTTTPQASYTTAAGTTAHTNPIILNAAGRVATGEIWITAGLAYKFVLYTSTDVLIATWDNITGIGGTGIATNALHVAYDPAGTGAVSTNVQAKLRQQVSVTDYGAVGNNSTNNNAAFLAAVTQLQDGGTLLIPPGIYCGQLIVSQKSNIQIIGYGATVARDHAPLASNDVLVVFVDCHNVSLEGLEVDGRVESFSKLESQCHNVGFYGCTNFQLVDIYTHHSPCDGVYINRIASGNTLYGVYFASDIQSSMSTLTNVISDYNSRQGMSVISSVRGTVINSVFNNTGKATTGFLAPASGVDLEPNVAAPFSPQNWTFIGCQFSGNNGAGLICASDDVRQVHLLQCDIENCGSYGIDSNGTDLVLDHVRIKNTGVSSASPRPSIRVRPSLTASVKLVCTTLEIEGALWGGLMVDQGVDVNINGLFVKDGANFGFRVVASGAFVNSNQTMTLSNVQVSRLFSSNPPTAAAYIMGSTDQKVILSNILLDRTGATGTPIERGLDLATLGDRTTLENFNSLGTFTDFNIRNTNLLYQANGNSALGVLVPSYNLGLISVYDPANIPNASRVSTSGTFLGAVLGDFVIASFSLNLQGINVYAYVDATDSVTVIFENNTGGAINLGSGNLQVKLFRA
jgi:hypothetical protein